MVVDVVTICNVEGAYQSSHYKLLQSGWIKIFSFVAVLTITDRFINKEHHKKMSGRNVRSLIIKNCLLIHQLTISHLLNTLLLHLSLFFLCREHIIPTVLRRADDQLQEFVMVVIRVVDQREIC